ncbi:methyltransferase domain-containing protein [Microbacterium sp. NEAU-LLC]|uniref:Methyltransferase domain-containing protein n=1 Tax=Microbacterium helvum TaxID=2773713 RepID=A0ABR8NLQ6_9MICO|nr:class I SAM-dependent methyltransferase [Microbacterium helvum]MBD3941605.1 methyltransferase domain-containing protein [Microbacterium helvum]
MADWSDVGEAYAASFAVLCAGSVDAVLDEAAARTGGRVLLDVGTGPGTVVAAAVARGWDAAGVDAAESMIATARSRHPGLPFFVRALPRLGLEDETADAVTANFVLNHVPDARESAGELARVAKPGGVVVATIWHGVVSPLRPIWDAVLDAAGLDRPADKTLPPDKDFGRDADGVAAMFRDAGLADVRARIVAWDFAFTPDELWIGVEGGVATVGGIYRAQDAATRGRMAAAYRRVTDELAGSGGRVTVPHRAVLVSGRPS